MNQSVNQYINNTEIQLLQIVMQIIFSVCLIALSRKAFFQPLSQQKLKLLRNLRKMSSENLSSSQDVSLLSFESLVGKCNCCS